MLLFIGFTNSIVNAAQFAVVAITFRRVGKGKEKKVKPQMTLRLLYKAQPKLFKEWREMQEGGDDSNIIIYSIIDFFNY